MRRLILASGSPRRRALLENYGFEITVCRPDFDESAVAQTDPARLVCLLAQGKNRAVRTAETNALVLSADTVVTLDGRILGKPRSRREAIAMLSSLSGRTHTVVTGVCLYYLKKEVVFFETTDVTFYPLTAVQIEAYVDSGAPFDKAGGYGIQDDRGIGFVASVQGELSNVIGLPMGRTVREIHQLQGEQL